MILPTKRIAGDKALLGLGARILRQLKKPQTVSHLWEAIGKDQRVNVTYDWFVLSLDLLFLLGALEYSEGRVKRART